MARTLVPVLRAGGLAALALALSHQLAFLVRYGSIYGEALVHAGHGAAWSDAVTSVLVGSGIALAAALAGLHRLGLRVRGRSVQVPEAPTARAFAIRWLRSWLLLLATVAVALTIQENVEHAAAGMPLVGPWILLSEQYPFAVAIVALVSLGISLVGSLLTFRREVLLARLRALTARWPRLRAGALAPAAVSIDVRRPSAIARRLGRRAPPIVRPA